ncbi:hypothetical protein AQ914_04440 [Burkholderia pseudomallei]|nr:hypothetical protein AQ914_04440 [Burkholderia pseudomallei]
MHDTALTDQRSLYIAEIGLSGADSGNFADKAPGAPSLDSMLPSVQFAAVHDHIIVFRQAKLQIARLDPALHAVLDERLMYSL